MLSTAFYRFFNFFHQSLFDLLDFWIYDRKNTKKTVKTVDCGFKEILSGIKLNLIKFLFVECVELSLFSPIMKIAKLYCIHVKCQRFSQIVNLF